MVLVTLLLVCLHAVGVFPFRTNMTRKMKMGYVQLQMQPACNLFPAGVLARGHVYHFSEIVQERVLGGLGAGAGGRSAPAVATSADWEIGYSATMQIPGGCQALHSRCRCKMRPKRVGNKEQLWR